MHCIGLVLGYAEFSSYSWNPAEKVASRLDGAVIADCKLRGIVLPVSFNRVKHIVPNILRRIDPSIVVGVGLNPSLDTVVVEAASVNIASFRIKDEDGYKADFEAIIEKGPLVEATTMPLKEIYEECTVKRRLRIRVGATIGTYLCNTLGYIIMNWAKRNNRVGGFLHIPPDTDLAMRLGLERYMSLNEIIEAVKCAIRSSIKNAKRLN